MAFGQEENGGEANRESIDGPAQEGYDNRAFPQTFIGAAQQLAAYQAFIAVGKLPGGKKSNWQELGPTAPYVVDAATYTGRPTYNSGRVKRRRASPRSCWARRN